MEQPEQPPGAKAGAKGRVRGSDRSDLARGTETRCRRPGLL
jgi:hypothetical protein